MTILNRPEPANIANSLFHSPSTEFFRRGVAISMCSTIEIDGEESPCVSFDFLFDDPRCQGCPLETLSVEEHARFMEEYLEYFWCLSPLSDWWVEMLYTAIDRFFDQNGIVSHPRKRRSSA